MIFIAPCVSENVIYFYHSRKIVHFITMHFLNKKSLVRPIWKVTLYIPAGDSREMLLTAFERSGDFEAPQTFFLKI